MLTEGLSPATERAPVYLDRATERPSLAVTLKALVHYRELLRLLVIKDLKIKYRGSVLGFVWSLLNPLIMIVVYTIAFKYIVRNAQPGFVFLLLLGLLPWTAFNASLMMSTGSVLDNAGVTKSVYFPRAILPLATVLFNTVQFLLTIAVFLPLMMVAYQIRPAAPMLLFPVVVLLQVAFTCGLAMIISALTVQLRDMRHLVEVGLAMLFWGTPIVYTINQVPERLHWIIALSPLSPYIVSYQAMFYHGQWPGPGLLVPAVVYAVAAMVIGARVFFRLEPRFGELV
jgi:ABC-type polysaccharide/polyol phosphate export permease